MRLQVYVSSFRKAHFTKLGSKSDSVSQVTAIGDSLIAFVDEPVMVELVPETSDLGTPICTHSIDGERNLEKGVVHIGGPVDELLNCLG